MHALVRTILVCALGAAVTAQVPNSTLPRGEFQPTTTPGIQTFAGWYTWRLASPVDRAPDTAGTVASARLVYLVHPDVDPAGDVTIQLHKSADGGRSWSAPQTLHTLATSAGAALNSEYETVLDVYAAANFVYVVWMSNEHAPGGTDQSAWVIGSADQGATWSQPTMVSTGVGTVYPDVNALECAATARGLHMAWLGDYVSGKPVAGSPATSWTGDAGQFDGDYIEDVFYCRVIAGAGSVGLLVPETNLTGYGSASNCDWLSIDALDDVVHLVWNDDAAAGLPSGSQDRVTRSATSIDGGLTFGTRIHTPVYGGSWDRRWFRGQAAVDTWQGTTRVYTFSEDGRNGADAVFMDRATATPAGLTWTDLGVVASSVPGDTEGFRADAQDGLIMIATVDYANRNTYATFDGRAGDEMVAGTAPTHLVRSGTPNWEWEMPICNYFHDLMVNGDVAAAVFEACSPEDAHLIWTTDRGRTARIEVVTSQGQCGGASAVDVDEVFLAVSGNGDVNLVWLDNRTGAGNAGNLPFVSGTKFPLADYDASTFTLSLSGYDPARAARGDLAYIALSGGTAGVDVPASLLGAGGYGHFVGLSADPFYFALWSNPFPFLQPLNPAGTVSWRGIPPLSALLGRPVHVVLGTLEPQRNPVLFNAYTDPITF